MLNAHNTIAVWEMRFLIPNISFLVLNMKTDVFREARRHKIIRYHSLLRIELKIANSRCKHPTALVGGGTSK